MPHVQLQLWLLHGPEGREVAVSRPGELPAPLPGHASLGVVFGFYAFNEETETMRWHPYLRD